jgi:hypothetical protein
VAEFATDAATQTSTAAEAETQKEREVVRNMTRARRPSAPPPGLQKEKPCAAQVSLVRHYCDF